MAAETEGVSVTTSAYTALSDDHAEVYVQAGGQAVRLFLGTSAPSVDTENYIRLAPWTEFSFTNLGGGTDAYARAETDATTVRVFKQ